MPKYSSKTSQSHTKNGGRRRKHTMRKLRRGKSRKVMRGGTLLKSGRRIMQNDWDWDDWIEAGKPLDW